MLLPNELILKEFGVATFDALMKKKTSTTDKLVKPSGIPVAPRRVTMTQDECKKLCDKIGLKYNTGYENRVIERVTTTESPDRYGDIVRAKGVDNTNYRKNPVVLFAHDHGDFPVGRSLKEWIDKSIAGWRSWDLYLDDSVDTSGKSDLTFRMVDSGAMPGGSLGFIPRNPRTDHSEKERMDLGLGKYGVEYLEVEKLEHSACSIPANPEALSNCLKSIERNRLVSAFGRDDLDRMRAEKMLDDQLLDIFASVLGTQKTYSIPKKAKEIVFKPYPNEHSARVRDPKDFDKDSFRRKNVEDGIDIIIGKLIDGDDKMITQAYRFASDEYTATQAKKWLDDHDIDYTDFEPASEKAMEVTVNVNIDSAPIVKMFDDFEKRIDSKIDSILAGTQRTKAKEKERTMGLYDRKEIEDILKV